MNIQPPPPAWEDGIDLRRCLDALVRFKWLILGIFVAAVAIAAVINYMALPPVYQASGGASLPSASGVGGVGMTLTGYREFASSAPVMDAVGQKLGLSLSASQLRNYYIFEVDEEHRFITVAATGPTPEQAVRRVSAWTEAYDQQVQAELQRQFTQLKDSASQQMELLLAQLTEAEEALARFDLTNSLTLLETRLASRQDELVSSETRLGKLTRSAIPAEEARLVSWQDTLDGENGAVGAGGSPALASPPISPSNGAAPGEMSAINPAYLELDQSLIQARLSARESELVSSENRLRELTFLSIPIEQEKLASLQAALAQEPEALSGSGNPGLAPNPVYLQLRQELADARVSLATQKAEVEALGNRIASLRQGIGQLREELIASLEREQSWRTELADRQKAEQIRVNLATNHQEVETLETGIASLSDEILQIQEQILTSQAARQGLESQVTRLRAAYEPARAELTRWLELEPKLDPTVSLSTIREPAQPASPVSPQRARNIALTGALGAILGISVALFLEYYRRGFQRSHLTPNLIFPLSGKGLALSPLGREELEWGSDEGKGKSPSRQHKLQEVGALEPIIRNFRNLYSPEGPSARLIWLEDNPPTCTMTYSEIYPGQTSAHHIHPWEHEVYIIKGAGTLFCDGQEYPVKEGDAIFIPPKVDHYTLNNGGQGVIRRIEVNPLTAARSGGGRNQDGQGTGQPPVIRNLSEIDQSDGPARRILSAADGVINYVMAFRSLDPGSAAPNHAHPGEHQAYILEGSCILSVDGKDYTVSEGDAVLVPPNAQHEWRSNSQHVARWLVFNPV